METHMESHFKSLRELVNDWFGNGERFRITRPDVAKTLSCRAVQVEVTRSSGTLALVFFRHGDGSWCVYPPSAIQPAMNRLYH
jgi:hypothetical protein